MLPIALDAMGGDDAPAAVVEGALRAVAEHGIPVMLVGPPEVLGDTGGIPVLPASEVIGMADDPASSVRRKKDATVVRAAEAVRDGVCSATVSAGNTGAAMAASLFRLGRIRGVSRPAIAVPLPSTVGTHTIMLDVGANAECQPEWLLQFAQMGAVYAAERFHISSPRVGLLSIGEEATKGDALVKATHELLAAGGWEGVSGAKFIGNVEGRDLLSDEVDVVVTDGFTGNVALKTLEGVIGSLRFQLDRYVAEQAVPGFALDEVFDRLDPETYGAALLLGVNGVSLISHGSSSAFAITNALRTATELVQSDLVGRLTAAVRT